MSVSLKPLHACDVSYNAKIVRYPDGSARVVYCTSGAFIEDGYEAAQKPPKRTKHAKTTKSADGGQARARTALRDLARANAFDLFVTFTLDATRVDRYDYGVVVQKLNRWLDNRVRRNGLKYVLVAEHHKDGAIHFHGLLNDVLPLADSGKRDKAGRQVFNMPAWALGFSTAVRLDGDYAKVCSYITKYITKGAEKVGGRWYYHGGDLRKPDVLQAILRPEDAPPDAVRFSPEGSPFSFLCWEVKNSI